MTKEQNSKQQILKGEKGDRQLFKKKVACPLFNAPRNNME